MKKKDDSEDDGYSTDEFEDSMDGGVDSKITAAKEYESDEFEVRVSFSVDRPETY